jgi:hypothetical protein
MWGMQVQHVRATMAGDAGAMAGLNSRGAIPGFIGRGEERSRQRTYRGGE